MSLHFLRVILCVHPDTHLADLLDLLGFRIASESRDSTKRCVKLLLLPETRNTRDEDIYVFAGWRG